MLKALLSGIKKASSPAVFPLSSDGSATSILANDTQLNDFIDAMCVAAGNANMKRRSDVVNLIGPADSAKSYYQNTDAAQEQLVSRFINLTKVQKADQISVIILAQSIKDVGGVTLYKDWNKDGSNSGLTSSSDAKLLYHAGYARGNGTKFFVPSSIPGTINTTLGVYDNGADEITGEVKIISTYEMKNGKWVNVSNEYLIDK